MDAFITLIPAGPCRPWIPCGPAGPCVPFVPLNPRGPCSPLVPLVPGGPGGPYGPILVTFLLSSNLTGLQNSTELTKKPSNGPVLHSYFLSSVRYWL